MTKPKSNQYAWLLAASMMLGSLPGVPAQDSQWSGQGVGGLWSDPNNWTPVGVPPAGNAASPFVGDVYLDAANGVSVITITNGETESPGVGNSIEANNVIYGPEWGVTLNVYGTLNFDWLMAPVQNDPSAPRSYINLYQNAVVSTSGAALGLGDYWFYHDAPYVTMNLYSNAKYNSFGAAGLWLGGHLNLYDNSIFLANGYLNMDFTPHQNDGTRSLNLGGGTLKLPEGFINGANSAYNNGPGFVTNLIERGIIRIYGKGYDTNDVNITDDGTNTILTPVSLGGTLQRIYLQSLPQTNVGVGAVQQSTLAGDFPGVSGVLLSSSEPGISPSSFPPPIYKSSNPGVATVDTNGVVTAVGAGTTTISAKVGLLNTVNGANLTVFATPSLLHEYKFNETSGSVSVDSVAGGSSAWNATLVGGASLGGGQVTLDGASGYVQLPAGILTNQNDITIETWASFSGPINTWANLFAFGDTDGSGLGQNYISFQPHTGGGTASANFGIGDPGYSAEADAVLNNPLDGLTNVHIVVVYQASTGKTMLYTNGVLAATSSAFFNNLSDPVAYVGPTYNRQSVLASTLGADPLNYIGQSLYNSDPTLNGSVDEFRIYGGSLTPAQIAADYLLGPNQLFGTSTSVLLSAKNSGTNVLINWPVNSALVTLKASPTLSSNAVWTTVNRPLTLVNGQYQVVVPRSGATQFFRLQ